MGETGLFLNVESIGTYKLGDVCGAGLFFWPRALLDESVAAEGCAPPE